MLTTFQILIKKNTSSSQASRESALSLEVKDHFPMSNISVHGTTTSTHPQKKYNDILHWLLPTSE